MCGISGVEFLVIIVAAIIFLGPDKLPELMKLAGRATRELRKLKGDLGDVTQELRNAVPVDDLRRQMSEDLQLDRARSRMKQTEEEIDALRARLKQKVDLEEAAIGGASVAAPLANPSPPLANPSPPDVSPSTEEMAARPSLDGPPQARPMTQSGAGAHLVGAGIDDAPTDPADAPPLPDIRPAAESVSQPRSGLPHGPVRPEAMTTPDPTEDET